MVRRSVAWIFLSFPALLTPVFAADPAGTIAGSVLDSSSAIVASARVVATNNRTGLNRETQTASDGAFVFPLLPVGPYTVRVEAPGFRRFEQRGIVVTTDASVTVPVVLQVGDVTEMVTVEATASQVETRSGTLG